VDSIVGRPLIRFLWYCVERFSIRGAAAVAAVCDTTRQFLQEEYGLASTTTVLNVPAAQEYESGGRPLLRSALGLPGTTPIVIYKGDIAANRGLLTFIKAMTPFDSLHFALIGTGPLTGELSSLAESLGLGKRVHFLGRISSGDFASYIGDADAGQVIHETRGVNMMVTLPSKLFDYIHASVPVIASDGPEIARIVRTWDIGWVVNPASQKSIEEAIAGFCAAFPDLSRYKANCRRAARQFCWENEKKQYLDFIGTSLGTREGPRRPDQRT
jgi:glycosyltransferase involved in cell wall biosynthesis